MKSHKKHDDWSKEKRREYNHIHYLNNKEKYSQRTKNITPKIKND